MVSTSVMPFATTHQYKSNNETIWVPLGRDALMIRYDPAWKTTYYFRPIMGMRKDWDTVVGPLHVDWADNPQKDDPLLLFTTSLPRYQGPKFVAIGASQPGRFIKNEKWPPRDYDRDAYRHDVSSTRFVYEPGKIAFDLNPSEPLYIVCGVADTKQDAFNLVRSLSISRDQTLVEMMDQVETKVSRLDIQTNSQSLDKAINWALASVDSLTMNVAGRGIYAGLHWFTQYWGRDTFISFQGSLLTTRDFSLARQFIMTMADSQDINFNSKTYGRVPNVLQPPDAGANNYETADGMFLIIHKTKGLLIGSEGSGICLNTAA